MTYSIDVELEKIRVPWYRVMRDSLMGFWLFSILMITLAIGFTFLAAFGNSIKGDSSGMIFNVLLFWTDVVVFLWQVLALPEGYNTSLTWIRLRILRKRLEDSQYN